MPFSKVSMNNTTLIDLTQDTAGPGNIQKGITAHGSNGSAIIGTHHEAVDNDVIFIDHLARIQYSYTAEEFLALEALPVQWAIDGLDADGWNWSLTNAKAYVEEYGKLVIGGLYSTSDNRTKLYMHIDNDAALSIQFNIWSYANDVRIHWGDDSEPEVPDTEGQHTLTHTYAAQGDYVISIESLDGNWYYLGNHTVDTVGLFGETSDMNLQPVRCSLVKVELAYYHGYFAKNCFKYCYNLETINSTYYSYTEEASAFSCCISLVAYIFGGYYTSDASANLFEYCYNLRYCSYAQFTTSSYGYVFNRCWALRKVTLTGYGNPRTLGSAHFWYCYSLETVVIPKCFTTISSSTFAYCYNLRYVNLDHVTLFSSNSFQYLHRIHKLTFPQGMTSVPNGVLHTAYGIQYLYLPNTIQSIGNMSFRNLYALQELHVACTEPPSVYGETSWDGMNPNCRIYVPAVAVNAYKSATHWSDWAANIFAEPDPETTL